MQIDIESVSAFKNCNFRKWKTHLNEQQNIQQQQTALITKIKFNDKFATLTNK